MAIETPQCSWQIQGDTRTGEEKTTFYFFNGIGCDISMCEELAGHGCVLLWNRYEGTERIYMTLVDMTILVPFGVSAKFMEEDWTFALGGPDCNRVKIIVNDRNLYWSPIPMNTHQASGPATHPAPRWVIWNSWNSRFLS
jgi:hypothetical protein